MSLRFQRRLLSHIRHPSYTPGAVRELAEDLGIAEEDLEEFEQSLQALAASGQVVYGDLRVVTLPPMGHEVVGMFRRNQKGFGFVIPRLANLHGDLFVPADATGGALTGDTVKARVVRERNAPPGKSPFVGEVIEVIERKRTEFSGELVRRGSMWIAQPDGKTLTDPVVIRDPGNKNAQEGDKVIFELTLRPEGNSLGEGVITRVIGRSGEPDVETQAVIAAFSLPGEFPEECVEQARQASAAFDAEVREAIHGGRGFGPLRRDLTTDYIITIDPPDAKDFDDAISLEKTERGWRLGVHIADVAHFIAPGSPLDVEAAERGNSVYLPRHVIPMLPEVLSNGICSLQEGVARYCKSAFMEYDREGSVRAQGFASTVIKSVKRLTYLEAQALIDGDRTEAKKHAKTEPAYTPELEALLADMNSLSRTILARRMKQGMIRLDLHEVELVFDAAGRVVDAQPEDDAFTHTLIEMFMVEANEAVARLFENLRVPLLRRTHPEPVPGDVDQLRKYATVAGFRIPKNPSREELQSLLESTRGTPAAKAVHFAVLRSLSKAEYSPALVGHFALASAAYAHFTSPIRRYPDLTVHRALRAYLEATENGQRPPRGEDEPRRLGRELMRSPYCPDEAALQDIGRTCNQTELNASEAEDDLRKFLVLQLLGEKVGESFDGVVTGVTPAGVFVQLTRYLAEGLIKTEDLPVGPKSGAPNAKGPWGGGPGRWRIDQRTGALVEQSTGRSFNIGDTVDCVVASVDLPARRMELLITDPTSRDKGKAKTLALKPGLLGGAGGGLAPAEGGAGFRGMTGSEKRSQRSKSRDKGKRDYRTDRKNKGKG